MTRAGERQSVDFGMWMVSSKNADFVFICELLIALKIVDFGLLTTSISSNQRRNQTSILRRGRENRVSP